MPSVTAITVSQFSRLIGLPQGPAVVDVRIDDDCPPSALTGQFELIAQERGSGSS